ncbi:MAG: molybdenum cofactor biosynthesis protein MoaE [Desulfuromonadaceae bacterium]|nr:molybdenum cofactor biosynthesis protein MoaE [Desulfuromonadaceae bacterium]MDD2850062.1 molybdenum cofactor biosynthesis protein MoaE [Desulfuromonadaceae bacterium]MDD4131850.1 molybdenum cofactor biosynthesis protein MoaE [Desulfuromonadaceae bacterium]
MISAWLKEVKENAAPEELGMILMHNGVVRGTSKYGAAVQGMKLSYDEGKLVALLNKYKEHDGIVEIKAWINSGELNVGDDIMYLMVAGRFRTDVFPIFEAVLSAIKKEVVNEMED